MKQKTTTEFDAFLKHPSKAELVAQGFKSTQALAAEYGIHPGTLLARLWSLEKAGKVETIKGAGNSRYWRVKK